MPLPVDPLLQDTSGLPPMSEHELEELGYTQWRQLPDGTLLAVAPMMFGNGRLFVDVSHHGHDDCFCYDSMAGAVQAMLEFDPERDDEPGGWKRHPYSGRRRPDGDPVQEFIAR